LPSTEKFANLVIHSLLGTIFGFLDLVLGGKVGFDRLLVQLLILDLFGFNQSRVRNLLGRTVMSLDREGLGNIPVAEVFFLPFLDFNC